MGRHAKNNEKFTDQMAFDDWLQEREREDEIANSTDVAVREAVSQSYRRMVEQMLWVAAFDTLALRYKSHAGKYLSTWHRGVKREKDTYGIAFGVFIETEEKALREFWMHGGYGLAEAVGLHWLADTIKAMDKLPADQLPPAALVSAILKRGGPGADKVRAKLKSRTPVRFRTAEHLYQPKPPTRKPKALGTTNAITYAIAE